MSKETLGWLNNLTLIGFTDKRPMAWHYKESLQGSEPNHYPGAIPVGDVLRRLFHWEPTPAEVQAVYALPNGDTMTVTDPARKAFVRPPGTFDVLGELDPGAILGIHSAKYQGHGYREWLLNNLSNILGDTLFIGSAGLLRGGGVAWVQIEMPDTIRTPEGVEFRPNLMATTGFDGSQATTYHRQFTDVVCDNTKAIALSENGQKYKLKHTKHSLLRIDDAREALAMVHSMADEIAEEVRTLCSVSVTDDQFRKFLDEIAPLNANTGPGNTPTSTSGATFTASLPAKSSRGQTLAENKRGEFMSLWTTDPRVSPWRNTAWGVLQAANTHAHHFQTVRNASRVERNMLRAASGEVLDLDRGTLATLNKVLAATA